MFSFVFNFKCICKLLHIIIIKLMVLISFINHLIFNTTLSRKNLILHTMEITITIFTKSKILISSFITLVQNNTLINLVDMIHKSSY